MGSKSVNFDRSVSTATEYGESRGVAPGATVLPVIHKDDLDLYRTSATHFEARLAGPVFGGSTGPKVWRYSCVIKCLDDLPSGIFVPFAHGIRAEEGEPPLRRSRHAESRNLYLVWEISRTTE